MVDESAGTIYVELSLRDNLTSGPIIVNALNTVESAANSMSAKVATSTEGIFTGVGASIKNTFSGAVSSVESSVSKINNIVNSIPTNVTRAMSSVGSTMTVALTAPLVLFGAKSTEVFKTFDDNMRRVQAATGAQTSQMGDLTTFAQTAGTKTGYTPIETSSSMITAAQAGLSQGEIKSQLPTILETARAGNVDVTAATKLISSAMTQWDMEGSRAAEHVGSVTAKVSNESKTEMVNLIDTYKYAGVTASQLNVPFEDLSAAIKMMADNGVYGRTAGTGLADMMLATLNPTKKATEALAKYGLTTKDVNVEEKGLFNVLETLRSKKVSTGDIETVFGKQGQRVVSALTKEDTNELRAYSQELRNSDGYLSKMVTTMNAGAGGASRTFAANLQNLEIHLGAIVYEYIGPLLGHLDVLIQKFLALPKGTQENIVKFAALTAAIGPTLLIASKLITSAQALSTGLNFLHLKAITPVITAFTELGVAGIAPIILNFASLALIVGSVGIVVYEVAAKTGVLKLAWQVLSDTLTIVKNIVIPGIVAGIKLFVKGLQDIGDWIANVILSANKLPVIGGVIDGVKEKVLGLADAWHQVALKSEDANKSQKDTEENNSKSSDINDHSKDKAQMAEFQTYLRDTKSSSSSSSGKKVVSLAEAASRSDDNSRSSTYAEALEKYNLKNGSKTNKETKATVDETVKYTVDSYGQLVKTVTTNVKKLSQDEVAAYAATAKAAGQAATFKVMSDGTVQASIQETTKVIQTEAGKWADAQQKAEESGRRVISSSSRSTTGELTRSVNSSTSTIKNGVKTTVDAVTTYITNMYGQIIGQTQELTKTVDDGINQVVSKTATEYANSVHKSTESSKDAMGNLKDVITTTQETVKNGVKTMVETVTTNIKNMYGKIISSTEDVVKTVDDGINKITTSSSSENTNNYNQTVENTVDAFGNIKQIVTDTTEVVKNGMSTITETVTTNMFDANKNLVSSTKNITETMKDGVRTIKNTYSDVTNAAIGQTVDTYKDAAGNVIKKGYAGGSTTTTAGTSFPTVRLSTSSSGAISATTSIPSVSTAATTVNTAASTAATSLNSMNDVSFSKLITNLNSLSKTFDTLNAKAQKYVSLMQSASKLTSGSGSSKTVNNKTNRIGNITINQNSSSAERTRKSALARL